MSTEKIYTAAEDRLNVITHGIGFIIALFASFILLNKGLREGTQLRLICYLIYSFGLIVFCIVWTLALVGIVLKFFFTGRYSKISTLTYVLMGWVIIIAIKPLIDSMATQGLLWLLAGGIFYTIGAILYQSKSMKYNHAIFHVFVLLGSFCHYIVILNYTN